MEELNYEEDVRIDPDALDVEWLGQSELMRRYTKHASQLKKEVDQAKERLEVGKAKLEMKIRANPEQYGLAKATEASIQSALILQPEYHELMNDYINTKYESDVAIGVVRSLDHRKAALEELVRLFTSSYFAGPQSPRNLSEEWNKHIKGQERKEQNARVKIQRRRTGKKEEKPE